VLFTKRKFSFDVDWEEHRLHSVETKCELVIAEDFRTMCLCSHEKGKLRYLVPALGDLLVVLLTKTGPRCISFRCKITVSLAQGAAHDAEADVADPVFVRSTIHWVSVFAFNRTTWTQVARLATNYRVGGLASDPSTSMYRDAHVNTVIRGFLLIHFVDIRPTAPLRGRGGRLSDVGVPHHAENKYLFSPPWVGELIPPTGLG